jgi:hypothetical protein
MAKSSPVKGVSLHNKVGTFLYDVTCKWKHQTKQPEQACTMTLVTSEISF